MSTWTDLATRTWGSLYRWDNPLGNAPQEQPLSPSTGFGRLIGQQMFGTKNLWKGLTRANLSEIAVEYVLGGKADKVNVNYPLIGTSVCFNADPFNQFPFNSVTGQPSQYAAKPIYLDISDRIQEVDTSIGRQYELDTISAGEGTFTILDKDEAFNPSNPSSPYYPGVKLYRQIADVAMWPPVPSGTSVNLLNTSAYYPVDPTLDSYAVGATPTPFVQIANPATPTIDTISPFSGTNCLKMAFPSYGGGVPYYVGWLVPCIPGQKYTTSVYAWTSYAFRLAIGLYDGDANGTDMNVSSTYTRLAVTFTATKPLHIVMVYTDGTALGTSGTIRLDSFQHEVGGFANPFATTGPLIAGLFGGLVERWPSSWNFHGTYGMASITATDGFSQLSNQQLNTDYYNAVLATNPDYYWPLQEPSGATTFGDQSGYNNPSLQVVRSKTGLGTAPTAGNQMNIVGDQGGTGVTFPQEPDATCALLGVGTANGIPVSRSETVAFPAATPASGWSLSFAFWQLAPPTGQNSIYDVLLTLCTSPDGEEITVGYQLPGSTTPPPDYVFAQVYAGGTLSVSSSTNMLVRTGTAHLWVVTISQDPTNTTLSLYIGGSLVGTSTLSTATVGAFTTPTTGLLLGGLWRRAAGVMYDQTNSTISNLALWSRVLSAGEMNTLLTIGNSAYSGDTSGQRIQRYLNQKRFCLFNLDTGRTVMGPSTITKGTATLDAVQQAATSENGNFFMDGFGTATFQGRDYRYLETAIKATFGEDSANGEIPYLDDINFDYDPTLVYNDVDVDQVDGIKVTAHNLASQNSYGIRSVSVTTSTIDPNEAADYANWILINHKDPVQRVNSVTIVPSANPALWPYALGLKFSDRIRFKRRTAAGYTMSADYFIERIERSRDTGLNFTVTYQLSPVPIQPWILEDPVYGILDSTTILGF